MSREIKTPEPEQINLEMVKYMSNEVFGFLYSSDSHSKASEKCLSE